MTWASRATRRQPFPTVRFSSAPTGTSTASRRIKRFEKNLIEHFPGTSGQNDHALHKRFDELPFQNWIGNFVGHAVVPVSEGSGLAAVARAEPRQRLERNRHSANFSEQGIEVSLAHAGGAGLDKPSRGPRPRLPDRYAVG